MPTSCEANVKDEGERLAAGAVPVPERLTVWVVGLALSVTVRVPVEVPVVRGEKTTLIVQELFEVRPEPQVFVWENAPVIVMPVIASVALPVFVRVTVWGLLLVPTSCEANVKEVGKRLAAGAVPVPERLTVWVVGSALSVTVRTPLEVPVVLGEKTTLTVQELPDARLEPQVFV